MINKIHFGKRVASGRKNMALSQAELAERLGVTAQACVKVGVRNGIAGC